MAASCVRLFLFASLLLGSVEGARVRVTQRARQAKDSHEKVSEITLDEAKEAHEKEGDVSVDKVELDAMGKLVRAFLKGDTEGYSEAPDHLRYLETRGPEQIGETEYYTLIFAVPFSGTPESPAVTNGYLKQGTEKSATRLTFLTVRLRYNDFDNLVNAANKAVPDSKGDVDVSKPPRLISWISRHLLPSFMVSTPTDEEWSKNREARRDFLDDVMKKFCELQGGKSKDEPPQYTLNVGFSRPLLGFLGNLEESIPNIFQGFLVFNRIP